ncbi:uncharacterized protein CCOS01_16428 [Colletotrichum costaricense]|uniref:Uncharacterized protein n=1 Tax=Colletotrichum costaricense TaxID=1209916 RepID=A0AAJ0DS92_9PEZI|nr:uncharacterized protein CCOS01_16428 [Colletotrichum costaricense]KAK1506569.1 hypothetical protein CCOS01_16428 [Colletotrichum costaricense]
MASGCRYEVILQTCSILDLIDIGAVKPLAEAVSGFAVVVTEPGEEFFIATAYFTSTKTLIGAPVLSTPKDDESVKIGLPAASRMKSSTWSRALSASVGAASGSWAVSAADGAARARHVVVAINAYTKGVAPGVLNASIPLQAYQIVSQPLDDNVRRVILPRTRTIYVPGSGSTWTGVSMSASTGQPFFTTSDEPSA